MTWRTEASCKGLDPDLFFPERGEPTAHIKAVCEGCPVKAECLALGLELDGPGVWGGTSERERVGLRAGQPRSRVCVRCGETFTFEPGRVGQPRRYCGEECAYWARRASKTASKLRRRDAA